MLFAFPSFYIIIVLIYNILRENVFVGYCLSQRNQAMMFIKLSHIHGESDISNGAQ